MIERTLSTVNNHGHMVVVGRYHATRRVAKRLGWQPGRTSVWRDPSGNRYIVSDGNGQAQPDLRSRLVR